jgi:hypothetical protein
VITTPTPMPTPFESATLNLKLFDMRRDPALREARAWFTNECFPQSYEEFQALMASPKNPWVRMVVGYWDMAASMVVHGAIDQAMFIDAHGEIFAMFAKLRGHLPQIREVFGAGFLRNVEQVVLAAPDAEQIMGSRYARLYARYRAQQAAAQNPGVA